MTEEELIGTTWRFNESLLFDGTAVPHGYIDFESNGREFTKLYPDGYVKNTVRYDNIYVYDDGWLFGQNDEYRTITILNVRSAPIGFISFLESNAKQVSSAYQFTDSTDSWTGSVEVKKKTGTKIVLNTDSKYVDKDIEVTINVKAGTASVPSTSITANPTITVSDTGLVTATCSASQSVTPSVSAGYVTSGTAGTVTVIGSNTYQLDVATVAETLAYLGIS